ncbi:MAG TPA: hypothetical protein PKA16_09730, partial [Ottowia sp.]|uniref:hypothetical protein n=1 Tax=Ottowia sp. TaxID=1898956 RepID=UPI002BB2B0B4
MHVQEEVIEVDPPGWAPSGAWTLISARSYLSDMSRHKPRESALSIGLAVFVTGLAFLLAPGLLKFGPFSQVLQAQLRMPGFFALGLGSLLIALHVIISKRGATSASAKPARRSTPT